MGMALMPSILSLTASARLRAVSLEVARRWQRAHLSSRDPEQARELMRAGAVALALLDASLAGVDPNYLVGLRADGARAPLICLAGQANRRALKRAGATEVVPPCSAKDALIARIARWVERATRPDLRCGPIEIESVARRARIEGSSVRLTRAEHALLVLLIARRGGIVTRSEISVAVLGSAAANGNVYFHVHNLKKKLGQAGNLLKCIRGEGYRLAQSAV
jgi:DNA-binding response OmpR family regulator